MAVSAVLVVEEVVEVVFEEGRLDGLGLVVVVVVGSVSEGVGLL